MVYWGGWNMHAFERGFRPFFISAAAFAAIAVLVWTAMVTGRLLVPSHLEPLDWHIHEMVFGYAPAVLAGFLLTAIPNWTGRAPVRGYKLFSLWILWLGGRIALAFSGSTPFVGAAIDTAFLVVLTLVVLHEVRSGGNTRNYPVCALIATLAIANVGFHAVSLAGADSVWPQRLGLATLALLITVIGGRVVPSFTGNWMAGRGLSQRPAPFDRVDGAAIVALVPALVAWVVDAADLVIGITFAIAAVALTVRLARWRGWLTFREPLVLILHVGFAWLPVWCALMAASALQIMTADGSSALHALSAGAIGTMTMAIMTRAALGHSGRPLTAGPVTSAIYVLIVAGAIGRTFAGAFAVDQALTISISGTLWAAGMALFALAYAPLTFSPKREAAAS